MDDIKAGIVLASRFIQAGDRQFQDYINYIDRDEAVRNEHYADYSVYTDYMDDPEKTTALFTADCDQLNSAQKAALKSTFSRAQQRGSLMWQNVISFDNRWLEKHGIYDSGSGRLDMDKLRTSSRLAMTAMQRREGMMTSMVWSAAIHSPYRT